MSQIEDAIVEILTSFGRFRLETVPLYDAHQDYIANEVHMALQVVDWLSMRYDILQHGSVIISECKMSKRRESKTQIVT